MKIIKILGNGGKNSATTMNLFEDAAKAKEVEVKLENIKDESIIKGYGVISTPGVVIDETVVHSGSVPSIESINTWLDASTRNAGCCGSCS